MLATIFMGIGLALTFAQNTVSPSILGRINDIIAQISVEIYDWLTEAGKFQQRCIVTGLIIWAIIWLLVRLFGAPPGLVYAVDVLAELVIGIHANPVHEFAVVAALPALVCTALLGTFVWLARKHPGGAFGVIGFVFDTPDIAADLGRLFVRLSAGFP